MSNYNILPHNSVNKYGTATLIRSELIPENLRCDTNGRVQIYNLVNITFANIYFDSGTDGISRNGREKLCSEVLPNLLTNSKNSGYIGGDFNCIIDKKDATNNPEQKMSRSLVRLKINQDWKDTFRSLHPVSYTHLTLPTILLV